MISFGAQKYQGVALTHLKLYAPLLRLFIEKDLMMLVVYRKGSQDVPYLIESICSNLFGCCHPLLSSNPINRRGRVGGGSLQSPNGKALIVV